MWNRSPEGRRLSAAFPAGDTNKRRVERPTRMATAKGNHHNGARSSVQAEQSDESFLTRWVPAESWAICDLSSFFFRRVIPPPRKRLSFISSKVAFSWEGEAGFSKSALPAHPLRNPR